MGEKLSMMNDYYYVMTIHYEDPEECIIGRDYGLNPGEEADETRAIEKFTVAYQNLQEENPTLSMSPLTINETTKLPSFQYVDEDSYIVSVYLRHTNRNIKIIN